MFLETCGCSRERGDVERSRRYILFVLGSKVDWLLSRGVALSCYSININKAHKSAWRKLTVRSCQRHSVSVTRCKISDEITYKYRSNMTFSDKPGVFQKMKTDWKQTVNLLTSSLQKNVVQQTICAGFIYFSLSIRFAWIISRSFEHIVTD